MKDRLTPEQSHRLIELGVAPSKASEMAKVYEPIDANHRLESEVPIFTIADLLELLPKEIEAPDYWGEVDTCSLGITTNEDDWEVSYYGADNIFRKAPELIDALYKLLVWCITNKYVEL